MFVTCHQPNFLIGLNLVDKIARSDAVIWLDEVKYTKGSWINRNMLPDGTWLTVPVVRDTTDGPIKEVRISEGRDWRRKMIAALAQHYGIVELRRSGLYDSLAIAYERLVDLNYDCANVALSNLGIDTRQIFQSDISQRSRAKPISWQLAQMVKKVGGDTYLSGPSGKKYLDLEPFERRGIEVRFHEYDGPRHSCVDLMLKRKEVVA